MTVWDNINFGLKMHKVPEDEAEKRIKRAIKLVQLDGFENRYPAQLSGGQQQRVAIARALAGDPPILIADEPTGNIDPELSLQIVELLVDINRYCGTTIVVVTHEHEIVRYFGGRVVSIENGQIAFDEVIGGEHEHK